MKQAPQARHWLVRVAVQADLEGSQVLEIPSGAPLGEAWRVVQESCETSEVDLVRHVASQQRLGVADLSSAEEHALKLLPEKVARRFEVFPLREEHHRLIVATSDPTNLVAEQAIGFACGRHAVFEVAAPPAIEEAIRTKYSPDQMTESLMSRVQSELANSVRVIASSGPEDISVQEVEKAPLVKLTNLIIHDAIGSGASDIHIEPELQGGCVRIRVDGVLRSYLKLPRPILNRFVSRIKVLGGMDIADRLRPHSGRTRVSVGGVSYDLRISTVPTRDTEKAVVRILSPEGAHGLSELALSAADMKRLRHLISQRDGIMIVTGPTGSGKTTTLYAAIRELAASGQINIMTVEDPVEYELSGVTQIQVAPRRGVTFASSLRAILRQDPDVILVGEIRDLETAGIAVQASVTGHLVLATLHTNDAVGVIPRLSALGLPPSAVAGSFRGAVAQRLIRRLCIHCVETIEDLTPNEQRLADRFGVRPTVRAPGCDKCGQSGYRGRLPVLELLVKSADMEDLIASGSSAKELTRVAIESGMLPMASMALERVKEGVTTLEEVERVLGQVFQPEPAEAPKGPHVLVIDHTAKARNLSRSVLEENGYRVTEAASRASALKAIEREKDLALIVAEVAMPGLDGHELLSLVRGSVSTVGLPVIVLTESDDSHLETRLMEEGADDYLRKPYVPKAFIRRVKATLERSNIHEPSGEIQTDLSRLLEDTEPSIAVLPFADMSPESDLEYLCEGLAEELINSLTKLEGLRVAARTSAFRFRDKGLDIRELGKQLGVKAVLEGSIRKSQDRLRISAQLVKVEDGYDLWSERYDRKMDDVFEVQDDIARAIVDKLKVTLLGVEDVAPAPKPTTDAQAYELYLKGRYYWNMRTEDGLNQSVEQFKLALARDSDFALAFAGLAESYTTLGIYGALPPDEVMPLAREAAEHALDIDPGLAEAHNSLGCVQAMYAWDWEAETHFKRAIEINPNYANAHNWYASNYLTPMGRLQEAHRESELALRLDPHSLVMTMSVGVQLYFDRRYDEAVTQYLKVIEMDPNFGIVHYFLGLAHVQKQRYEDGIAELEQAESLTSRSPEVLAALAHAHAMVGEENKALQLTDELIDRSRERYVSPVLLGQVYAGLGDYDAAFDSLEKAYSLRSCDLIWLKARPVFDVLRSDRRFGELCARIFFPG